MDYRLLGPSLEGIEGPLPGLLEVLVDVGVVHAQVALGLLGRIEGEILEPRRTSLPEIGRSPRD